MNLITRLEDACRRHPLNIALPESDDRRTIQAAAMLVQSGCVRSVVLLDGRPKVIELCTSAGVDFTAIQKSIVFADEQFKHLPEETIRHYLEQLKARGKSVHQEELDRQSENRLLLAGELLFQRKVDAVVAGAVSTTAEVIRAAISSVGLASGCRTVSGSFILTQPDTNINIPPALMFADSAVVPEPSPTQLVDIASSTVATWNQVMAEDFGPPRLAFLSFSTKGSATHPASVRMAEAAAEFKRRFPAVNSDGELQFDAAIMPEIATRKCPESPVAGRANILIFPDLNSGNIAYKIAQRLGRYSAYGPLLQGLNQPYCDLSRGASASDIYAAALINLLRART